MYKTLIWRTFLLKTKKCAITPLQFISYNWIKSKHFDEPDKYSGEGSVKELADRLIKDNVKHVFIAASRSVMRLELLSVFIEKIQSHSIKYTVFTDIQSDPTIENIEYGLKIFNGNKCDCVLAAGGGSVIDCAKIIALRASNPNKSVIQMTNYFTPLKKSVPVYVIPTTSGSGSEATMFSVITNTAEERKCPVLTSKFMPRAVVLDPDMSVNLPQKITAYTGMDALTHAIEAYISTFADEFPEDKKKAPYACKLIFENLHTAFISPDDKDVRLKMSEASYYAAIAFRRISTGYVHAIAHRIGELYHVPHGCANAILLPYILEEYMPAIEHNLAELSEYCGFSNYNTSDNKSSYVFINKIKQLNKQLNIPDKLTCLDEKDFDLIIRRSNAEARLQGRPVRFSSSELKKILTKLK